jgi:hypothetical protein
VAQRRRIDPVQNGYRHGLQSRMLTKIVRSGIIVLLASMSAPGCSGNKEAQAVDPNAYPANYKSQIATFLMTVLTDNADFRTSLIAPPVLKQVGDSQHYIACVQLNGHNQHRGKAVIYLGGAINQYVDATGDQCVGAAYEPFKELVPLAPR